jgi:hypothetical protein
VEENAVTHGDESKRSYLELERRAHGDSRLDNTSRSCSEMDLSSHIQGLGNRLKTDNFLTGKSADFADLSTAVVTRWKMI